MTHYFFSGIGGSGMLPLAQILKGQGHQVSGSDRARDQGRTPEKFAKLEAEGFKLFPQDGSGLRGAEWLVVSTAIEDTVPDVAAAKAANIPVIKRAQLLADLFNSYPKRIAVGGTSGKTTTTGMIGFILKEAGFDPVLMNGGVLKNYGVSALTGKGDVFITESDESDGSIELYKPDIAVLTNISIDHKGMDELRQLFADFIRKAREAVINMDNDEALALREDNAVTYSLRDDAADFAASHIYHLEEGTAAIVNGVALSLDLAGNHNLSNALAAIAAVAAYGVDVEQACDILARFHGIKRRMEWIGEANGITVLDDFAHNPDKITASLSTLRHHPGRLIVIFQMHGYGPLKLMWQELAETFKAQLGDDDILFLLDPLYLGGTADRSIGTEQVAQAIGPKARYTGTREAAGASALLEARPGDRLVVMGARDDTLSTFAEGLLQSLRNRGLPGQ